MIEYIALVLLGYIVYQDYFNRQERKKLTDAFLAKDLKELKEYEKPVEKPKLTVDMPDDIPLTEASLEQFDAAIRKEIGKETIADKVKSGLKRIKK